MFFLMQIAMFFGLVSTVKQYGPVYVLVGSKFDIETRMKVAVIDTGFDLSKVSKASDYLCRGPVHMDVTGTGLRDANGHGTNIVGVIGNEIDSSKYCVVVYKYWANFLSGSLELGVVLELILKEKGVVAVNLSSCGRGRFEREADLIKRVVNKNIVFVNASGNDDIDLNKQCIIYPPCYSIDSSNFVVVGNGKNEKTRHSSSNYGDKVVKAWIDGSKVNGLGLVMSGSSQAAALYTAGLVRLNK